MSDCTVVVCSCDAYSDIWGPFFTLLEKKWPDNPFPVVLNTGYKTYSRPGMNIKTFQLYPDEKAVSWSKRLMEHLKRIDTEYVLILMEDFFLKDMVDTKVVLQCKDWMDQDKNITCFGFCTTIHGKMKSKYPGFMKRKRFSQYKYNTQAGIWRREDLLSYLREDEDPWIWEFIGNLRSFRSNKEFYVTEDGVRPNFNYNNFAIVRGKWNRREVNTVFQENNIYVDYSIRGFIDEKEVLRRTLDGAGWKHLGPLRVFHSYIVNILKHPKSLF